MISRVETETRETLRSRRKRAVRAKSIAIRSITKGEQRTLASEYPEADEVHASRPRTRGECQCGHRPCPFISCRYHLAIEINANGNVKLNFPDLEVWEMSETCALDVADRGPVTLERIGDLLNITRERVRQLEERALLRSPVRALLDLDCPTDLHTPWEVA